MRACRSRVTHPSATPHDAPRLACVKPAASVHPEPGSNSSLYKFFISLASWRHSSVRRMPGLPASHAPRNQLYFCLLLYFCTASPVLSMISCSPPENHSPNRSLNLISRTGLQRYYFFLYLQIFSDFFFTSFGRQMYQTRDKHLDIKRFPLQNFFDTGTVFFRSLKTFSNDYRYRLFRQNHPCYSFHEGSPACLGTHRYDRIIEWCTSIIVGIHLQIQAPVKVSRQGLSVREQKFMQLVLFMGHYILIKYVIDNVRNQDHSSTLSSSSA